MAPGVRAPGADAPDLLDDVTPELLNRYARQGPRYTSYPTAPEWHDFDEAALAPHLAAADGAGADAPLSVYTHLPFCESMCAFCGCSVVVSHRPDRADPYLERIEREAELWATRLPHRRSVDQLHWGGGTPTFLSIARIERLWRAIFGHFALATDAEVSIEVDPRVTTPEQLAALRGLGFNRLSMGVQDFDPRVQEAIRRIQPPDLTQRVFDTARALGFGGINLDLIYGLPHQDVASFTTTLRRVIEMGPDRIAVFGYAHVPWLKPHQRAIDESALPQPEQRFELYRTAWRVLTGAGYRAIGMDHFARADDELAHALDDGTLHRNFQGYTTRAGRDMVSLGETAIADVAGAYAQNHKSLIQYYGAIDRGHLATHRGCTLSDDDLLRRRVIVQLMCNFRLRKADFAGPRGEPFDVYFAADLDRLREFADAGLLELADAAIAVPPRGRIFIRNVCMAFDAYLHHAAPETTPRFSQTI